VIDSVLLSCRAPWRGIERALMNRIERRAREKVQGGTIQALFLPTRKNKPAAAFYEQQGSAPAPE
jgi:predicted enzyme involved in methoxymalonyl-ACP biosynthesis